MTLPPSWNSGQGSPPHSGYPVPPGTPPPYWQPPRGNRPWFIVTVAAALVLVVAVGVIAWKLVGTDDEQRAAPSTTATSSKKSTTTRQSTTTPTTTRATATATATATLSAPPPAPGSCDGRIGRPGPDTPAGWKQVVSPRGLVYDVPPEWEVLPCTTLVGWEKKCPETPESPFGTCPIRTMSGAAQLPNPACPDGNWLAVSGAPGAKSTPDINQAVQNETATVKDIYTSESGVVPNVSLSAPRDLVVAGSPAVEIVATVTGIATEKCNSPSALHLMIATTVAGQQGSVMFVVSMGYQGNPDTGTLDSMVKSLRVI